MRHQEMQDEIEKKSKDTMSFIFKLTDENRGLPVAIEEGIDLFKQIKNGNERSIEDLINYGQGLDEKEFLNGSIFEFDDKTELKDFDEVAKKFDVKYALETLSKFDEETNKTDKYVRVTFSANKRGNIDKAIEEFTKNKLEKSQNKDTDIDKGKGKAKVKVKVPLADKIKGAKDRFNAEMKEQKLDKTRVLNKNKNDLSH